MRHHPNMSAVGSSTFFPTIMREKSWEKTKLCGYLNKLGNRSLIKLNKRRWFVYNEENCKLYYYRNPDDLLPLGDIDISHASFFFDVGNVGKTFEIRTNERTYYLESPDRQTMMYWLQELQERRRRFSKKKTKQFGNTKLQQRSGLAGQESFESSTDVQDSVPELVQAVSPTKCIGENTASQKGAGVMNFSLSNIRTEIRNALYGVRSNRQSALINDVATSPIASPATEQKSLPGQGPDTEGQAPVKKEKATFKYLATRRKDIPNVSGPQNSSKVQCQKCHQLQQMVASLKDDIQITEEELIATREVVKLLQKQIDLQQREIELQKIFKEDDDMQNVYEVLRDKDKQILNLESLLASTKEEREIQHQQNRATNTEMSSLQEQVSVLQEMIVLKDHTIMDLTTRVYDLENKSDSNIESSTNTTLRPVFNSSDVDKLKDTIDAYTEQNKFLSQELLELNRLRADDEVREKLWNNHYTELESDFYKLKSNHLKLLNQIKGPTFVGQEEENQDLVSELVQDAIGGEINTHDDLTVSTINPSYFSGPVHDQYGFLNVPNSDSEDYLIMEANRCQRKSGELSVKDVEVSTSVKWENFFASQNYLEVLSTRSQDLKLLIRQGIPTEYREKIWIACTNFRVETEKSKLGEKYFSNLLEKSKNCLTLNPVAKQIELDLLRTLPNNKHYQNLDSNGTVRLRNVLMAFSWHDSAIGYCQGMNRLAAMALLFLNEKDAFWCLVAIIEHIMPKDYYSRTLLGAHADQRVLKDLIAEKLPRLHAHVEHLDIDPSLFTFNWFLTIFVDTLPVDTFLRIWDTFLYEGSKVLFRYALAIFKYCEDDILACHDTMSLNKCLRLMGDRIYDVKRLTQIAFDELNPFPMKYLKQKREYHYTKVEAELRELDEIRADFVSHQPSLSRTDSEED